MTPNQKLRLTAAASREFRFNVSLAAATGELVRSAAEGEAMPEQVRQPGDIRPGDVFEDCRFHPCYCYDIGDDGLHVFGISLIDGSTWQCHIVGCAVRKLTPAEAWRWKSEGPAPDLTLASGQVMADATEDDIRSDIAGEEATRREEGF